MIPVDERLQALLASVPDRERTQRCLERLRHESPEAYRRITESSSALRCAVHVFSYSSFLSDAVMRDPEWILETAAWPDFYRVLTAEEYENLLLRFLGKDHDGTLRAADLARFRRRQLLRIVLRDVLDVANLSDVTAELSALADAILDVAYQRIRAGLVERYGEPRLPDGSPCGFSVIALGKLGGQELNYSSDVDLLFLYAGNGETDGSTPISNKEFYKKVANEYTSLLSTYTGDGACYRVDLRLRPDGTLGEICISGNGGRAYYAERARDWEKQMLIKARVCAGDREPGAQLLEFVEPLIYQTSLDFRAVEAVSETRQRISEKIAARRGGHKRLDVKLMPGGIRDIEFLVQCLQRLYGGREHWVRHAGTMLAMFRLRDKDLLSAGEHARLAAAYEFLRYLEHRLQMEEDRQTHALPVDAAELDLLARKMPGESTGAGLMHRLEQHRTAVQEIYDRVVHAHKPLSYTIAAEAEAQAAPADEQDMPPAAELAVAANVHRGRERLERLLESAGPEQIARLSADAALAQQILDLFEHSPLFGDELLRDPNLLDEVGAPFEDGGGELPDRATLRRFYRRQMVRIQSASILQSEPIFSTLGKTSLLADRVIASAYRMALEGGQGPAHSGYVPCDQMMVIALGRLGMSEFDLGSDADLVFVLPDADAGEHAYWTAVARRMIQTLSAYTGEGVMFAVDTRLRPNGREGDLVQSEGSYKMYFASHAEAWEGITYMKARGVAGNSERATAFLHELQEVDWRRYGQSMRSRKELAEMRARLEREQGPRNPLKAGMGGYYDIDFALMYLRLRGAGIFYKVLNTPERLDVIEKMGHLDREDADFLREAATFYRAVDHGQRVSTGHAEGSLPTAQSQFEMLTGLVRRWTPEHLHREPLDVTLREIRGKTRDFFNRLFGR